MKNNLSLIALLIAGAIGVGNLYALNRPDDFYNQAMSELDEWSREALLELDSWSDSVMAELQQWILQPWEPRPMQLPEPSPFLDDPIVPPVVIEPDEPQPVIEDKPVAPDPVVIPVEPRPAPEPPKPVIPVAPPQPISNDFTFVSYGTNFVVNAPNCLKIKLTTSVFPSNDLLSENIKRIDLDALSELTSSLIECRDSHNLSDWAFYKLTEHFVKAFLPGRVNEQELLQGLLLICAGYDVQFASARGGNRLYACVGISELLLDKQCFYSSDSSVRYYPFEDTPDNMCFTSSFPSTRPLSPQPSGNERYALDLSPVRRVVVCSHNGLHANGQCPSPIVDVSYTTNRNMIAFYNECPQWINPNQRYTNWHTYGRTSIGQHLQSQLYPALRNAMAGKTTLEKANIIIKFVEAFPYALDSEMWGVEDRALFPEETLFYPKRDCEDGAILFTRLIRDLIGLKTAYIYYPGHLAAAVAFNEPQKGAYIDVYGKRYTVCDPTYYHVDVGIQMPPSVVDSSQAVLIPLD